MPDFSIFNGSLLLQTEPTDKATPLGVCRTDADLAAPLAQIIFQGSGAGSLQGLISFQTNLGAAGGPLVEHMRIHANGNVGIGVTAPAEKLEVAGKVKAAAFQGDGSALTGVADGTKVNKAGDTMTGVLNLAADGLSVGVKQLVVSSGNVGIGTPTPAARLQVAGGAIMPAAGNSEAAGLMFPKDPGGGTGDAAWIRYYARRISRPDLVATGTVLQRDVATVAGSAVAVSLVSEATTLEIGVSNEPSDHIALMPSGGVGIGTNVPTEKLDVRGEASVAGMTLAKGGTWRHRTGGDAAILSDGDAYKALMIVGGDYGQGKARWIRMWDSVQVHGELTTDALKLGDKWRLSGVGDVHGNDGWLRLFNGAGADYWGGLAAGSLWTKSGALSGCDVKLKDRIEPLSQALEKVLQLAGVSFMERGNEPEQSRRMGVVAQQVEPVVPEVVKAGPDGLKGVEYSGLVALLIEAVKGQQGLLTEQRALIDGLRTSIEALQAGLGQAV